MAVQHVVVDGSNIATEGRTSPSLAQLDEAVRAFLDEFGDVALTVVVDATFGHRIDEREREEFEAGIVNGELVSPPAGAIGRGDAFILQVADKAEAAVFSNDSFQEFHGSYDWLFDEGRLVGGKPVPAVGWVFVMRTPVRGPTSRRATRSRPKKAGTSSGVELGPVPVPTKPPPRTASGSSEAGGEVATPAKSSRKRSAKASTTKKSASKRGASKSSTSPASGDEQATKRGGGRRGGGASTRAKAPDAAGERATDEASSGGRGRRRRGSAPAAEAVNEPMVFLEFVAAHPVGTEVEATVDRFSSHGAYAVSASGAQCYIPLKAMADPPPTKARDLVSLGEVRTFLVTAFDTPRRSIDVGFPGVVEPEVPSESAAHDRHDDGLRSREHQSAEEAPSMAVKKQAAAKKAPGKRTAAEKAPAKKGPAKKAPAKKSPATKSPAKKSPATKSPAKKAPAKKSPAKSPAKKSPATKSPAKKSPATKSPAKKSPATKSPAKKSPATKSPAKKSPATKSPAKKSPATKSPAKKAPAKKAPAKKSPATKAPAKKAGG